MRQVLTGTAPLLYVPQGKHLLLGVVKSEKKDTSLPEFIDTCNRILFGFYEQTYEMVYRSYMLAEGDVMHSPALSAHSGCASIPLELPVELVLSAIPQDIVMPLLADLKAMIQIKYPSLMINNAIAEFRNNTTPGKANYRIPTSSVTIIYGIETETEQQAIRDNGGIVVNLRAGVPTRENLCNRFVAEFGLIRR